jgi:hypothetical protein
MIERRLKGGSWAVGPRSAAKFLWAGARLEFNLNDEQRKRLVVQEWG